MRRLMVTVFVASLLLTGFATAHKFYVSVTNINYSEEDDALQITSRIFIDDLENVLEERYGVTLNLATEDEAAIANEYIEKYFRQKFALYLDDEVVNYEFLGKKYDIDVAVCYLELPKVGLNNLETLTIQNEILTDLFDEQKNIVHVKWKGKKKSFVLIKSDTKGMLNL